MNNVAETVAKDDVCTIFDVKIRLENREPMCVDRMTRRVFRTFVSLQRQLNGVVMPSSLSIDSRTCSAFFCSADGDVEPIM